MRAYAWIWMLAMLFTHGVVAQVPELGRWQNLELSPEEVIKSSAQRYRTMIDELAQQHLLDEKPQQLVRIRRIAATLIEAAVALKPQAADWPWEIHITGNPDYEAACAAGGKLIVGMAFVERFALNDGELATLIGHEIAHAIAEHHRESLTEVLYLDRQHPRSAEVLQSQLDSDLSLQLKLAKLFRMQEQEADQLGMVLMHRAGWSGDDMVSFYHKLAQREGPDDTHWSHPSASSRYGMARALAVIFSHQNAHRP